MYSILSVVTSSYQLIIANPNNLVQFNFKDTCTDWPPEVVLLPLYGERVELDADWLIGCHAPHDEEVAADDGLLLDDHQGGGHASRGRVSRPACRPTRRIGRAYRWQEENILYSL